MSFAASLSEHQALETPMSGAELAAEMRADDRSTARRTMAVGQYARHGDWDLAGYASPVHWLKDQAGMTGADAYRMLQLAKKLRALPVLAQAWLDGRVTGGQVRIVCEQVIDRHLDRFGEHEDAIVPDLVGLSMDDTLAAMRLWRARADALRDGPEPDDRPTAHLSSTLDDRGLLSANLNAEAYALWKEALRVADSEDQDMSPALRRGEALTTVVRFFLDHQDQKLRNRNRPHLNIVINAETLGTDAVEGYYAATGMYATPSTLQRMLCDCDFHRMLHRDGEILDYGRASRLVSPAQWQALVLRDQGCRFKGCDRPAEWCEAHHVVPYSVGGETDVSGMALHCSHHHEVVHRPGWHSELSPDGTLTVWPPDGPKWTTKPRLLTPQLEIRWREYESKRGSPLSEHLQEIHLRAQLQKRALASRADLIIEFDRAA
jgi:hypothetical protein